MIARRDRETVGRATLRRVSPAAAFWIGLIACLSLLQTACTTPPQRPDSGLGQEIALFAMSLLDTGYRFGGKNPEAGLDCSGMAAYVLAKAAGIALSGSAADIARRGRALPLDRARAGDLVFFDTRGGPYTHVGVYLGDGRFVHAPSSARGKVRVDSLKEGYFARRFSEARAYVD